MPAGLATVDVGNFVGLGGVSGKGVALTGAAFTTSARARTWGYFSIEVQAEPAQRAIWRAITACSPVSMYAFMQGPANAYMDAKITARFLTQGDAASKKWLPLTETTQRIRQALGYDPDWPINQRTGQLMAFVKHSRRYQMLPNGAMMVLPDLGSADATQLIKLVHAQFGAAENPLFPGVQTPPRPVLALSPEADMANLLKLLQAHIVTTIGSGGGGFLP